MGALRTLTFALVPLVSVLAWWLVPIALTLPAPDLPARELTPLTGNATIDAATPGVCRVLQDPAQPGTMKFCEDVVVWEAVGLAILSCDKGRGEWNTVMGPLADPDPRGVLYAYHYSESDSFETPPTSPSLYPLPPTGLPRRSDFHPLGIEVHPTSASEATLYVINHRRDRSVIEVFRISAPTARHAAELTWKRTLAHPKIWTPNSIAVLGQGRFLLSNDHYTNRRTQALPWFHYTETALALPGGSVEYVEFDEATEGSSEVGELEGVSVSTVARWIPFANGLALTQDRKTLAVASSTARKVYFYDVHDPLSSPSNENRTVPTLKSRASFSLPFGPDNIGFTAASDSSDPANNRLLIAGHPHGLSIIAFAADPHGDRELARAGSHVGVLDSQTGEFKTMFRDDGRWFGSSSAGVILGEQNVVDTRVTEGRPEEGVATGGSRLLVTGLYELGVLECRSV